MSVAVRLSSASLTVALMRGLRLWIFELGAGLTLVIVGLVLPVGGVAVGSDCQVGVTSLAALSVIWLVFWPPEELMVQMLALAPPTVLWKAILVPSGE